MERERPRTRGVLEGIEHDAGDPLMAERSLLTKFGDGGRERPPPAVVRLIDGEPLDRGGELAVPQYLLGGSRLDAVRAQVLALGRDDLEGQASPERHSDQDGLPRKRG